MAEKVKLFIAGHCGPCQEVKRLIGEGKFNLDEVDLIDLETEEGYSYLDRLKLSKVPSAYLGEQRCKVGFDEENDALIIECPVDGEEE